MKKINIPTKAYEHENFIILIMERGDTYEAWLHEKTTGIMMYIYGVSTKDYTYNTFKKTVRIFLPDYIKIYKERYDI